MNKDIYERTGFAKYFQTEVEQTKGNCLQACLATVMQMPMDRVINVVERTSFESPNWQEALLNWFHKHYIEYYGQSEPSATDSWVTYHELLRSRNVNGMFIAIVDSANYEGVKHAVIMDNRGVCFHDPHPEQHYIGRDLVSERLLLSYYNLQLKGKVDEDQVKLLRDNGYTHLSMRKENGYVLPVTYNEGSFENGLTELLDPKDNYLFESIDNVVASFQPHIKDTHDASIRKGAINRFTRAQKGFNEAGEQLRKCFEAIVLPHIEKGEYQIARELVTEMPECSIRVELEDRIMVAQIGSEDPFDNILPEFQTDPRDSTQLSMTIPSTFYDLYTHVPDGYVKEVFHAVYIDVCNQFLHDPGFTNAVTNHIKHEPMNAATLSRANRLMAEYNEQLLRKALNEDFKSRFLENLKPHAEDFKSHGWSVSQLQRKVGK